jgi:hypothetical protein
VGGEGGSKGAAATGGLRNLMRQSIAPRRLLAACFTEWARSPFIRRRYTEAQVAAVRDAVRPSENRKSSAIVEKYRAAAALLRQRP